MVLLWAQCDLGVDPDGKFREFFRESSVTLAAMQPMKMVKYSLMSCICRQVCLSCSFLGAVSKNGLCPLGPVSVVGSVKREGAVCA